DPARILITGYTDMEAMVDAINKGEIFRYLKKPWDENELHAAIKNAYEVYKTRKKLNEKIIELQRANDELNRFVYSTSHDLRSPLANIMAILSLIKVEQSVNDPNNYLQMIETSVARMDLFIHKIIEYYKSSRVEEINENVDFNKLIQDSIDVSKHNNPKINFIKQIEQKSPFKGDSFRIAIIINNLISNAIKYQKPDEENKWIKISVAVDEKNAQILIEDNGVGIIESHLNNIFKMFFRSIDLSKGLGIGLYIVKEALNKIGGDISVSSTIGKGTSFALTLPNKNYAPMYEMFE
ncbi:MAG: ATP-binding protein, partial [Chitinophagaceae bacterium]